jgi:hypothetical protein
MCRNDSSFLSYHPGRGLLVFLRARQAIAPAIKGRQRICREPPDAFVATSASSSLPSLSWSTCATVKTVSVARACHGAARRIFRAKPFASMVRTRSIQERVTPGPASTTISARPAGHSVLGPRDGRHAIWDSGRYVHRSVIPRAIPVGLGEKAIRVVASLGKRGALGHATTAALRRLWVASRWKQAHSRIPATRFRAR